MNKRATVAGIDGAGFSVLPLEIPIEFQFCVDAGAAAALSFFDDPAIGLHDHIALSMHWFMESSTKVQLDGLREPSDFARSCTDAFAAGYLGRIQQNLARFSDALRTCRSAALH